MVCSRLITASFYRGTGVDLFDDAIPEAHYPPDHPRLANLRDGYATPADLLRSRLQVVRTWKPGDPVPSRNGAVTDTPAAFGSSAPNPVGSPT